MYRISMRLLASLFGILTISGAGISAVVINEVELNPSGDANEWVELYNNGEEEQDVGHWSVWIVDFDPSWTGVIKIPQQTLVAPGGFLVVEGDRHWIHRSGTGTVILKTEQGTEVDKTPLLTDQSDNIFTNSRYPNGFDTDQRSDWVFGKGTKNANNT